MDINIGTLLNANVALDVRGTADEPVAFLPVGSMAGEADPKPWGQLRFDFDPSAAASHHIAHASFIGGGGAPVAGITTASLEMLGRGHLSLDHVTVTGSANVGVYSTSPGTLTAIDSSFTGNRVGLSLGAFAQLRRSDLSANPEGGVINRNPNGVCIDALANFWGSASGPDDASATTDACLSSATNDGSGSAVSNGVLYRPFLTSADGGAGDHSNISPEPTWVTADGVSEATVTITLRDAGGAPISGKTIELNSTLGMVEQAGSMTDEQGQVVARLSSTDQGVATLIARNTTDNSDLGALGAVVFWAGSDGLGLVASGGTPYFAPQIKVVRPPFEQGFPMTFSVPMKNANPTSVDVTLTYAISGFGIGVDFGDVGTVSKTLAPGEEWDAAVNYIPVETGNRCVSVRGTVDGLPEADRLVGSFPRLRRNFSVPNNPCDRLDVNKLVPNKGGIGGVIRHMARALGQAHLAPELLNSEPLGVETWRGGSSCSPQAVNTLVATRARTQNLIFMRHLTL